MDAFWIAALVPAAVLAVTLPLTGAVLRWLQRRAILDRPVERSSHAVPVPRGGGLALVPLLVAAWLILAAAGLAPPAAAAVAGLAAALALLSWVDDLRDLPAGLRLVGHIAAALAGIACLPPHAAIFQGLLPPLLDHAAAVVLWVWFVNLFNFMDGIDGITGVETACIAGGMTLVLAVAGDRPAAHSPDGLVALAPPLAAAALGFLRWNWHPARIFLGDVGSVSLGFLLGFLLLSLAARGAWAPALILPLYYLADASVTLARRVFGGQTFWRAHREHFYQRALAPDGDHAAVARLILAGDLILAGLAVVALGHPWWALADAAATVAAMLGMMARRARRARA